MDYGHLLDVSGPAPRNIIDNAALIYCMRVTYDRYSSRQNNLNLQLKKPSKHKVDR